MKSKMPTGIKTVRKMTTRIVTGETVFKSRMCLLVKSKSLRIRRQIQLNLQVKRAVTKENSHEKRVQTKNKKKLNPMNDKRKLLTTIKLSSCKRVNPMALANQNRLRTSQK